MKNIDDVTMNAIGFERAENGDWVKVAPCPDLPGQAIRDALEENDMLGLISMKAAHEKYSPEMDPRAFRLTLMGQLQIAVWDTDAAYYNEAEVAALFAEKLEGL